MKAKQTWVIIQGSIPLLFSLSACNSSNSNEDAANCRFYASLYSVTSSEEVEDVNPIMLSCALNRESLVFTCSANYTRYSEPQTQTKIRHYSSIDEFVDEAEYPGKVLRASFEETNSAYGNVAYPLFGDSSNQFDELGRLIVAGDNTFTSWDRFGRPTAANPVSRCAGPLGDSLMYDDEARTMAWIYDQPGARAPDNSRPCIRPKKVWTFDIRGNVLSYETVHNSMSRVINYEVMAKEKVCK